MKDFGIFSQKEMKLVKKKLLFVKLRKGRDEGKSLHAEADFYLCNIC